MFVKKSVLLFASMLLLKFAMAGTYPVKTVRENSLLKQEMAVRGLIQRIMPGQAEQVKIKIVARKQEKEYFEISNNAGKVFIKGNTAVAVASGLNWYLKYFCNLHYVWNGSNMNLPAELPLPKSLTRIQVFPNWRVYMNYCTFNYSAAWWDWQRWEREIDFMAMNGINMPLSVVGLEGVWYNCLRRIGYSDEKARDYLVGPAFLAWQWMTNIESTAGPLPKNWIDQHVKLGKKIMQRELEFGMQPIQQGFTGAIPRSFIKKYPKAKIALGKSWCNFTPTAQLDPLDPLFKTFGKIFLEEQDKLFGSHGYYAADPFHEGTPPRPGKAYLKAVGAAIENLIVGFDPKAKIAMQAWSIRKDIATAISKDKLLILDLKGNKYKEKGFKGFWGYDYIVGNLHNFGGRINIHGDLHLVASNQYQKARKVYPNAVGSGLFMEGIGQNPLYYDMAFEMPFHSGAINPEDWLKNYAKRRYGMHSEKVEQALVLLLNGPYKKGTNDVENSSIIAARPALDVKKSGPNAGFDIPYPPMTLVQALSLLLSESDRLQASDGYRYDVVDITRQCLSNLGQRMHKKAARAFLCYDQKEFALQSGRFLQLLQDTDTLLGTREDFSFDHWLKTARAQGTTAAEKDLYEYNASLQLTWWGADKEPIIFDYAWKEWSGLISGYYLPRWQQFYGMLQHKFDTAGSYSEKHLPLVYGRETLRANPFYSSLADWEQNWIKSKKVLKPLHTGREIEIAKALFIKYQPLFKTYYP